MSSFEPTARQKSEIAYHEAHAQKNADVASRPVSLDVVNSEKRRWWNAYWTTYSLLRGKDLKGKNVLVAGCGFGEDAIRLAHMGAQVYAFDISPDIIELTRQRVETLGITNIDLKIMPSEAMAYEDDFFDYAFFLDILHHVDIPNTVAEIKRVVKPGGEIIGDELYTHSVLQKNIRESWLVRKFLYPRMQGYVYGDEEPYITDDEHKIDEDEFKCVQDICAETKVQYYNILVGRIFPFSFSLLQKMDRIAAKMLFGWGRFMAGRIVFVGKLN